MCEVDGGLGGKTREVTHSVQILGSLRSQSESEWPSLVVMVLVEVEMIRIFSTVAPVITKWDLSREATAGDDVVIR